MWTDLEREFRYLKKLLHDCKARSEAKRQGEGC